MADQFQVGDRVRVLSGVHAGLCGVVREISEQGHGVAVALAVGVVPFFAANLERVGAERQTPD